MFIGRKWFESQLNGRAKKGKFDGAMKLSLAAILDRRSEICSAMSIQSAHVKLRKHSRDLRI